MNIQPIDLPSLLRAVTWPVITAMVVTVFRLPLASFVSEFGQRVSKLSFGKFEIDMAQVQEMRPSAMDTEIRQLEAGLVPQSGSNALNTLVNDLLTGGRQDYILIDLGSENSPRWLTSRLYLLCFLITVINRQLSIVFVETVGDVRKKFVGIASPDQVRWSLAYAYGWLESAAAAAYANQVANPPAGVINFPTQANQFAPAGAYYWTMIPNIIQQFLMLLRSTTAPTDPDKSEWVSLDKQQTYEHAKWLNGGRIERLLAGAGALSTGHITLMANQTLNDVVNPILAQRGPLTAALDPDKTFLCLVDRSEVLDTVAGELVRQTRLNKH